MFVYILLLIFTLFSASSACNADELAIGALIRGVNEACLTIESGELVVEVTTVYAREKSESEIDVWIQQEKKRGMETIRALERDVTMQSFNPAEFEKTYLNPYIEFQANWYRQRTSIEKLNVAFQLLQEPVGVLPPYKMTIREQPGLSLESLEAQHHQADNFYLVTYDTQSQVREHVGSIVLPAPSLGSVRLSDSNYYAGYRPFASYGRFSGRVPMSAKRIKREIVEGATCDVLAFETETGWNVQIWVDPLKDFCIHRAEWRKTQDKSLLSSLGEYKQFRRFGDVWYPGVTQLTSSRKEGIISKMTTLRVIEAEFNVNFPKDLFKIDRDFYNRQGRIQETSPSSGLGQGPIKSRTEEEHLLLFCGPQSLLRVCDILNVPTNLNELKKLSRFDSNRGTTMLGLKDAAAYKGLAPTGVRTSLKLLKQKKVPLPAIAYVDGNHFLVFESVNKNGVQISDPALKYARQLSWKKLSKIWDGELLIFDVRKGKSTTPELGPLALVEEPEYNFGRVLGGMEVHHTFTVKNIGQKPLNILSVTETCSCTASVISHDEIPAGGTGMVQAVLTVPSENASVQESLLVLTDDPTQHTLTLTLKGQAFVPLTTFPERIPFGNQELSQNPLRKRVSLHVQEDVQFLGVRTDSAYLKIKLEKGEIPYVEVQVLPSVPFGTFSANLLVDYRYEGQETTHNVPIFGEVLGEFRVAPKRLFFGLIKEPEAVLKTVTIASTHGAPFKITSAASSSKAVTVTVKKTVDATRYQLHVTIDSTAAPGQVEGEIVIETSNPNQSSLRVPVFGIIANSN